MTNPNPLDDAGAYLAREYARQVHRVSADLRDLADTVDRYAEPGRGVGWPGPNCGDQAGTIVHKIMSALPNLGLDGMVHAAASHDLYLASRGDDQGADTAGGRRD